MEIVTKRLDELRTSSKNVRRHTDKQLKEYVRSIEKFEQIKPVVIDESGEILAGNGLYLALKQMGRETCECYIIRNLSAKDKKKLMLADNRVYELGITDMDIFDEIIRELDGDVDVPGWDEDLIAMMNASFRDVDDMIESYGSYDESDVAKLSRRKATKEEPAAEIPASEPAPQMTQAPTQKVVICPKCGEQICL